MRLEHEIWQSLACRADFIGEVECITAGGSVARYRVLARWKGRPEAGDELLIEKPPARDRSHGYPLTLVGQRFVVAAFTSPPSRGQPGGQATMPPGAPAMYLSRALPVDFRLPRDQGMASPDDPEALQDAFGTSRTHPAALRRDIEAFLNSPDPELELLKALALDELAGNERMERQAHARALALAAATGGATPSRPANPCDDGRVQAPVTGHADAIERAGAAHLSCAPDDPVLAPILAARSTPEVVRLLLEHARRAAPDRRWPYVYVLAGGGVETRRMVADLPLDTLGDDAADYLRVHLRHAAGASGNDGHALAGVPPADAAPPPTAAVLHTWRTRLGRPSDARWDAAFMGLTRHDPATVVRWLVHQTGGHHRPVAWFGHACTRDCARHLGQLAARARDPWARTAAAIYLAFHDEPAGLAALRSAMTTPGGPGAWAALALARRGDATALRRAAQVLDPATRTNDANDPTRIESLRERVLELLSNSLAREGVHLVLPGRPRLHDEGMDDAAARDEGLDARVHAYAQDLLARHPDLVPVDPWLPALAARRVD